MDDVVTFEAMEAAIKKQLMDFVDMQVSGLRQCYDTVKAQMPELSDEDAIKSIFSVMQDITGITHDTLRKQLDDTKKALENIRAKADDVREKLAKGEL